MKMMKIPHLRRLLKKHLFDSPSPVKNEIILATQYTPITLNKIEKEQMSNSVQINLCPPATSLLQPCAGIIWRNNSCGYDAVLMVLYFIWRSNSPRWCESF